MRTLLSAVTLMLFCAGAGAARIPITIYDGNPQDLWNRLYGDIAVRTEGAMQYGVDNSEPFREPIDDPGALLATLDEFLAKRGEERAHGDLARALLLNDVWAAFDMAATPYAGPDSAPIQRRLATLIGRLRLSNAAIASLPDNYADAVKSGKFPAAFDPENPSAAFLPPDLRDPNGSWVEIQDGRGELVTPFHVGLLSGRSVFRVFIHCPGGRQATLSYLMTLNLFRTPWELKPAEIGTEYPSGSQVRMNTLRLDPQTPQFPAGTVVALLRQMMVINDRQEPVPTAVTQKVQFRVYTKVGVSPSELGPASFSARERLYEFDMRRRDLLTGTAGGLHALTADEKEYQLAVSPKVHSRAVDLPGRVVLSTCPRCHVGDGIVGVNSYSRLLTGPPTPNPQLLPAGSTQLRGEATATVEWKKQQFNWGLWLGLLGQSARGYSRNGKL